MTREQAKLSTDGKFLARSGHRWLVKGITYGPFATPLDDSSKVSRDLDVIVALGFNSLRLYENPSVEFLQLAIILSESSDLGFQLTFLMLSKVGLLFELAKLTFHDHFLILEVLEKG